MRYPDKKPLWAPWYHRAPWTGPNGLRAFVLRRDPVCKICQRQASTICDHKIPHKGVWALFISVANLQGICKECHDRKTATEDGGFGNAAADPHAAQPTGTPGGKLFGTSPHDLDKGMGADDIAKLLEDV